LEKSIDNNVKSLIDLIERKYLSTSSNFRPLDFGRTASFFTLDVISSIAFEEPFGDLETDSDVHKYLQTTQESVPVIILVTVIPWLSKLLQTSVMKWFLPSEKDKIGLGRIIGLAFPLHKIRKNGTSKLTFLSPSMAKEVVGKRFGPNKIVKKDMLGSFISHGLTQEEAESESLVQM
jgi:hypothetical protein